MTRFKARIRLLEALLQNENGKIETAWASKELGTTASVLRYFEEQGLLLWSQMKCIEMQLQMQRIFRMWHQQY